jgi:prepilin-type N-terminal cleavage/methylation domain-containing protein
MYSKDKLGFTLIEVMVVTAIIGIITLVGVPKYQAYKARGVVAQAKVTLDSIWTAQQSFFMANDRYSTAADPGGEGGRWFLTFLSDNELGIIVPKTSKYRYGTYLIENPSMIAFAHLKNFWETKLASCSANVGDARYKWEDGSSSASAGHDGLDGC